MTLGTPISGLDWSIFNKLTESPIATFSSYARLSPTMIFEPPSRASRSPTSILSGIIDISFCCDVPLIMTPLDTSLLLITTCDERKGAIVSTLDSSKIISDIFSKSSKPPLLSSVTCGITPNILFWSSFSNPFITDKTIISTAVPKPTPSEVRIV